MKEHVQETAAGVANPAPAPEVSDQSVSMEDIVRAHHVLREVIVRTPLQHDAVLSAKYKCNVYLKREDLQVVRSFKIRGAYNMIRNLTDEERARGIVCASAGNHAQGVAFSCNALGIQGKIYMPSTTPNQKVKQVKRFGGSNVEVVLIGDTFDDAFEQAMKACKEQGMTFIHPFDAPKIIAGNGTVGMEIMESLDVLSGLRIRNDRRRRPGGGSGLVHQSRQPFDEGDRRGAVGSGFDERSFAAP